MRTNLEIVSKIRKHENDFFGFISTDLLEYLSFDLAKQFLEGDDIKKVESGKAKWKPSSLKTPYIIKSMKKYMVFALSKAENHRGLSASRSIEHFKAWIWLLGNDDYNFIRWNNYKNYGAPVLRQICEKYQFAFPDDNIGLKNMSQGLKCSENCKEGCGK